MQSASISSRSVCAPRRKGPTRSGMAALATALGAGMMGATALATTYIYTPDNTTNSTWSNGAQTGGEWSSGNVVPTPPSSSTSTVLTFGQSSTGTNSALDGITNVNTFNITNGNFSLTTLNLEGSVSGSDTGSVSINGSSGSTLNLSTGLVNLDATGAGLTYTINTNVNDGNNTSYNGSGTSTFVINGAVSGASNLVKNGSAVLILAGNNTFGNSTHGLEVFGGTVQIGDGGNTGTPGNATGINSSTGSSINIGANLTLAFDRSDSPTFVYPIVLDNGTATNFGILSVLSGTSVTWGGVISTDGESLAINPLGTAGTLNLTGINTYTSKTQVSAGVVNVSNNQSAATGGWSIGPSNAFVATTNFSSGSTVVVASANTIRIGNTGAVGTSLATLNSAGTVTDNGSLAIGRDAALNITGGVWTQNGSIGVNSYGGFNATLTVNAGGSFSYNDSTPVAVNGSVTNNFNAIVNVSGGTFTTGQAFSETAGSGGSNTNGILMLTNGGTLTLSANIASLVTGTSLVPMQLGNGSGGIINTAGFNTSIGQTISNLGAQAGALTLSGGGTVTLSAINTYTGPTNVSSGTLTAGIVSTSGGGAFGLNSAVTMANSSTAILNLNNFNTSIGSLTGGGTAGGNVMLGSGTLTLGGDNTSPPAYAGSISGTGGLIKNGTGTQILSGSNSYSGGTNASAGTLIFAAPGALPVDSSLTITSVALAVAAANTGTKNDLLASSLNIAGISGDWTGKLDLTNNDMIVQNGNLTNLTDQVKQGYAGGSWQGSGGIVSSNAAADTTHLTAIGVIQNNVSGGVLYGSFDSNPSTTADVLLKYTYYGDANLDGKVDGSDYSLIDNGYLESLTGWFNGDFNYDGVINGSDYTLIDNAFNSQGTVMTDLIASPTAQIAESSAVPEPASLSLLALAATGLLGRRLRRK